MTQTVSNTLYKTVTVRSILWWPAVLLEGLPENHWFIQVILNFHVLISVYPIRTESGQFSVLSISQICQLLSVTPWSTIQCRSSLSSSLLGSNIRAGGTLAPSYPVFTLGPQLAFRNANLLNSPRGVKDNTQLEAWSSLNWMWENRGRSGLKENISANTQFLLWW